jgi:hypothetical protein
MSRDPSHADALMFQRLKSPFTLVPLRRDRVLEILNRRLYDLFSYRNQRER